MTETQEPSDAILHREQVAAVIQARLDGKLTNAQLSKWAFDQFYKIEVEELQYEDEYDALLSEILDELMFADEASFQLEEQDLRMLARRLQS